MAGCADDAISVSAAFADPLLMWLDVMILDVSLVVPAFVSLAPPRKLVAGLLVFRFAQLCSFGFKCPPVSWSS